MANYVRPVKDYTRHPISAAYRKPGKWVAGYHTGVDIQCPVGTPVYATVGGDVRTQRRGGSRLHGSAYGVMVVINDDVDGSDWMYCHLSRVVVSEGQKVATGQLIGYSGNTGNSTGPARSRRTQKSRWGLWLRSQPQPVAVGRQQPLKESHMELITTLAAIPAVLAVVNLLKQHFGLPTKWRPSWPSCSASASRSLTSTWGRTRPTRRRRTGCCSVWRPLASTT